MTNTKANQNEATKYGLTFTDEKISETEFTLTRKRVQKWGRDDLITVGIFRVSFIDTDPTSRLDVNDGWSRLGWGSAQIYKTRGIAAGVVRRSFKSGSWNHTFDADLFIYPHRSGYSIANTMD